MTTLVYSLIAITVFKIIIDLWDRESNALYSVFLENVIFLIFLFIILRIHFKQKMGEKEKLAKDLESISENIEILDEDDKR
jgi:hypothetical protein